MLFILQSILIELIGLYLAFYQELRVWSSTASSCAARPRAECLKMGLCTWRTRTRQSLCLRSTICLCMPTQALSAIAFLCASLFLPLNTVLLMKHQLKDFNVYFEVNHQIIPVLTTTFCLFSHDALQLCFCVTKRLSSHMFMQ